MISPMPHRHTLARERAVTDAVVRLTQRALRERHPADRALAAFLRAHREYGSRDRRMITAIVYGVFRWWGWLRALLPSETRDALGEETERGGAVPPAPVAGGATATLDAAAWAPLLLAAAALEGLAWADLQDAWLRRCKLAAAELDALRDARGLDAVCGAFRRAFRGFGRVAGLGPADLVPAWLGEEIACPQPLSLLIEWLQRRPPLWLRAQGTDEPALLKELADAGLEPVRHPVVPAALHVGHPRVNLYLLPAYREGRVEVQDLASQLVGHICAPLPGQRWWDACAGGGGKTLSLAQLMQRRGTVVATDIRERKRQDLRRRTRRAALPNVRTRDWDGQALPRDRATFDGVLVDAPCTCSGTWRRNPAARWTLRRAEIAEMARIQTALLAAAASGVKPGGVLVYATCSFFRAENEEVVQAFLAGTADFHAEPFRDPLSGRSLAGSVQTWPWDGDCDAMFVARFRRSAPRG
jgi:16S rRNA (cytosine967-C5)-methyltransferase